MTKETKNPLLSLEEIIKQTRIDKKVKEEDKERCRQILQCVYMDNDYSVDLDTISAHIKLTNENTLPILQQLIKEGKVGVEKRKGEDWYVGNNSLTRLGCVYHDIFG